MSRMGKKPLLVPDGVKIHVEDHRISVEGPLGKLDFEFHHRIAVVHDTERKMILVSREGESREAKALHGLTRALIQNMMVGVTRGYEKKLEIFGVGYLAAVLKHMSEEDIVEFNIPTGIPYVFEFDDQLNLQKDYFVGDPEVIRQMMEKVANQAKKK